MSVSAARRFLLRLFRFFRSRPAEADLAREIESHLQLIEDRLVAQGLPADEARAAARRRFGNVAYHTDLTRDMWAFPSLDSIRQDVRYAARALRRSPGFSAIAIGVLTIGIAGTTVMFSLTDAVRLRAIPFAESDRLVVLWGNVMRTTVERRGASYPDFRDWRAQATSVEDMAAFDETRMTLSGVQEASRILVETVSASYFSLLRVNAAAGRTFTADEDEVPQKVAVVVLSHDFWRRQCNGDDTIVGRALLLDARPYTVIGVMPPGFRGLGDRADVWIPFVMSNTAEGLANRGSRGFQVLARLRPNTSRAQAQTELDTISRRLEQAYPDTNETRGVEVASLDEELLGGYRPALRALTIAVAFVLLIACANVANLLLARSEARQREIAVRTAIGAGWARLLRQLVTESCVFTGISALAGVALAAAALGAVLRFAPVAFPSFVHPRIDARAALFTVAVSLVVGTLLGLAPAAHSRISRLSDALKESSRTGVGRRGRRLRSSLVVAEVSLAVVLLVGAALMIRTVQHLLAVDPGFDPDRVLTARVSIPREPADPASTDPAPLVVGARLLLDRVRVLPGVRSASLVSDPPLSGLASAVFYSAEGQGVTTAQTVPRAYVHRALPDFFATMGIPFVHGRTFLEPELTAESRAVIVSERVATRFWAGQDPIGKRIKLGPLASKNPWLAIVGVVREVKYRGLPENPTADPDLYFPFLDRNQQVSLVVRTDGDPAALVGSVRQAVREVDPAIPVFAVFTMTGRIAEQTAQSRFTTWVMGVFATIALLLSALGIYGVMSYLVAQRTREVGIRMALGATRRDIVGLVVGGGARLVVAGLLIGAAASLTLERLMKTLIFQASVFDAGAGASITILAIVGLIACYWPARRASRVDPLVALRTE